MEIVEEECVDGIEEGESREGRVVEELEEREREEGVGDENKEWMLIIEDNGDVGGYVK